MPYFWRTFKKKFTKRTGKLLFKVTPEYGLSMRSGIKGTHFAIVNWLPADDVSFALDMLPAQLKGFADYVEETNEELRTFVVEAFRRARQEGGV